MLMEEHVMVSTIDRSIILLSVVVTSPYKLNGVHVHADINECSNGTHSCEQVCNNTQGSHHCLCYSGYELNEDGFTCTGNILHTKHILMCRCMITIIIDDVFL